MTKLKIESSHYFMLLAYCHSEAWAQPSHVLIKHSAQLNQNVKTFYIFSTQQRTKFCSMNSGPLWGFIYRSPSLSFVRLVDYKVFAVPRLKDVELSAGARFVGAQFYVTWARLLKGSAHFAKTQSKRALSSLFFFVLLPITGGGYVKNSRYLSRIISSRFESIEWVKYVVQRRYLRAEAKLYTNSVCKE